MPILALNLQNTSARSYYLSWIIYLMHILKNIVLLFMFRKIILWQIYLPNTLLESWSPLYFLLSLKLGKVRHLFLTSAEEVALAYVASSPRQWKPTWNSIVHSLTCHEYWGPQKPEYSRWSSQKEVMSLGCQVKMQGLVPNRPVRT